MSRPIRFEIGDTVTFKHQGTTQEGRVRGVELVHDPRKRRGWHFIIEASDYEIHDVHQDDIGGVVGAVPSTSHYEYLTGCYEVA